MPIPTGNFSAGPTDLFVLSLDGDLELWFDSLTSPAGQRTLVADYPGPFAGFTEGPGPNVIDQVTGVVDGSVVFGDRCKPISGTVLAATDTDEFGGIAGSHSPTLSPTGDLLGAANTFLISQTSADRNGEGISRQLDEGPQARYLNVGDLKPVHHPTALLRADDTRRSSAPGAITSRLGHFDPAGRRRIRIAVGRRRFALPTCPPVNSRPTVQVATSSPSGPHRPDRVATTYHPIISFHVA